jgi:hypothetical protein
MDSLDIANLLPILPNKGKIEFTHELNMTRCYIIPSDWLPPPASDQGPLLRRRRRARSVRSPRRLRRLRSVHPRLLPGRGRQPGRVAGRRVAGRGSGQPGQQRELVAGASSPGPAGPMSGGGWGGGGDGGEEGDWAERSCLF